MKTKYYSKRTKIKKKEKKKKQSWYLEKKNLFLRVKNNDV